MITEFEAKFLNVDVSFLKKQLAAIGALQITQKTLMRRRTFDLFSPTPIKQWVRVRDEGNRIAITLKRVSDPTKITGTQELEFSVESFDKACEFLTLCGLVPKAYQESYRENWSYAGAVLSFDIWPGLPAFLEIEGADESIVRAVAHKLNLDFEQSFFGAVDIIYEHTLGIPAYIFNQINELTFENVADILKTLRLEYNEK